MKEDSNPRSETPARGGEIRPNMPQAPRREFGDRTDELSRKGNPSRIDDEREPEAHKFGDRTDQPDVRDQGPHMQPTQASGQGSGKGSGQDQRSGSTKQDQQKKPDAKSGQGQDSARKGSEGERDSKAKPHDEKSNRPQGGGTTGGR